MRAFTCALLIPLVAVSGPALCGQCYAPTYTQSYPTYQTPTYQTPTYQTYNPYVVPVDTFYQVGQGLLNARLADEAAKAAVEKYKAELAAQAGAAKAEAASQADLAFKQQVLQLLAAKTAPAAVDPRTAQLEAENAQMRAALEKIIQAQRAPAPSGPPAAGTPSPPAAQASPVLAAAQKTFNDRCVRCHKAGSGKSDFTDVTKLDAKKLIECKLRMKGDLGPDKMMPPRGEGEATIDDYFAVDGLLMAKLAGQ